MPETREHGVAKEEALGGGEHILVVEDEAGLRKLIEVILLRLDYQVAVAANGGEALLLVEEKGLKPDLVITDVVMPGMSGSVLVERLRKNQPDLNVLYMSGYTDNTIVHHGVFDPGTPFIQKPFNMCDVAERIQDVLREGPTKRPSQSVLMIDDDVQCRELVHRFCRRRGHDFAGVSTSAAALEALAAKHFDVLLVDMNIPGTDGGRVLREIRAASHTAPAVMLSGDLHSVDIDSLRPLGAIKALEKSSDFQPLMQTIEELETD